MEDRRRKIRDSILSHKNRIIDDMFAFAADLVMRNKDFSVSLNEGEHDMLPMIESVTGRKVRMGILSPEDKELLVRIIDAAFGNPDRETRVEILTEICASDTLFEGMCLVFGGSDDELEEFAQMLGCAEMYDRLSADSCFTARKKYAQKMDTYAAAAADYYGACHYNDLVEIIKTYEDLNTGFDRYRRSEGSYRNTIFFTPEYFFMYTLKELISGISTETLTTVDGLLLNEFYEDQYVEELNEYVDFVSSREELGENEIRTFFALRNNAGYRSLVLAASRYDLYIPPRKKLMKYADNNYAEETRAETRLRRYVKDMYADRLEARADEYDCTLDDVLDDFVAEFQIQETEDMSADDSNEMILRRALHVMEGFGIEVKDGKDRAELAEFVEDMLLDTHKWVYHGWTPREAPDHLRMDYI